MQTPAANEANNSPRVSETIKTTGAPERTDIKMLMKTIVYQIKQTRGQMKHTLKHLKFFVS